MADDEDRQQIQDALARMIVELSSEGTTLDREDRDVLAQYGAGAISREAMIKFFHDKAARMEEQIRRPQ